MGVQKHNDTRKIPRVLLTEGELRIWARDTWVVYANDTNLKKKLLVRAGAPEFRLFHGEELLREWKGDRWIITAVRTFNEITKPPVEKINQKQIIDNNFLT